MEERTNYVCIGLDGGGTSTRLRTVDARGHRWTDENGASNPRIVGITRASKVISSLVGRAMHEYPDSKEFLVCAGIAGAAAASMQRTLADSIKLDLRESAGVSIQITDDVTIAYEAAFAGDSGILLVVGTGSIVLVKTVAGMFIRSGGWGYLLGDEGSGYSIGRAGMRAVAASIDSGETTPLTTQAAVGLEVLNREALIAKVYGSDYSPAAFARAVLEEAGRGDIQSLEIIDRATRELVNRLFALIDLNDLDVTGAVKITGGLSRSRPYLLSLESVIRERFSTLKIARSGREPVEGALWMANRMARRTTGRMADRVSHNG